MDNIRYLHIEISSICNAACPACPRYFNNSPLAKTYINPDYITFDKFKEWFPENVLRSVEHVNLCGNHGDPGTNKEALKIMEYLSQFNFKSLEFHTNGSLRTAQFWTDLSRIFSKNKNTWVLIFSVDGLEDTNHIYRRNTNWNKITTNIKAAVQGGGKIKWEYLVFKHNEHQLEQAKEVAKELGVDSIAFKAPFNVSDGTKLTPIPVLDNHGKLDYYIHASTLENYKPTNIKDTTPHYEDKTFTVDAYNYSIAIKPPLDTPVKRYCKSCEIDDANSKDIVPICGYENEVYIDTHGNIFPCCFIGVPYWDYISQMDQNIFYSYAWEQYYSLLKGIGLENLNLKTIKLEEVIDRQILHSIHRDKWNKSVEEGKPIICSTICGKNSKLNIEHKELQKELLNIDRIV